LILHFYYTRCQRRNPSSRYEHQHDRLRNLESGPVCQSVSCPSRTCPSLQTASNLCTAETHISIHWSGQGPPVPDTAQNAAPNTTPQSSSLPATTQASPPQPSTDPPLYRVRPHTLQEKTEWYQSLFVILCNVNLHARSLD
jgi:hypothetical protein